MSYVDVLRLIFEVLVLLGVLYLAFFKHYFQEKGKNLATKEDIEDITAKVEAIKTRLNFSAQAQLTLAGQAQTALIDYFSKHAVWLHAALDCGAATMDYDEAGLVRERERFDQFHRDFDLSAGKMSLLVDSAEIQALHAEVVAETFKLHAHAHAFTFACLFSLIDARKADLIKDNDEKVKKFEEHHARRTEVHKKFKTEQEEMYRVIGPIIERLRRAVADEIRRLAVQHAAA